MCPRAWRSPRSQAREMALAGGADAFLEKPLDPLRFVSTVKDLLGRSAFLRQAPEPADERAPVERASAPRRPPWGRPAHERDQRGHRAPRHRQDDPRAAVRVRERDARASGALHVHCVRAAREVDPLRRRRSTSSPRRRSDARCSTRISARSLNEQGLDAVSERIGELISERSPGIIVIDSFKALSAYADAQRLPPLPARPRRPPQRVSGQLLLDRRVRRGRDRRRARVRRRRRRHLARHRPARRPGDAHPAGAQAPGQRGIVGRARLPHHLGRDRRLPAAGRPRRGSSDYALSDTRISSGIAALDELLADGYWPGASTLCAGPSGSGKTLMGLHFVFNGARDGDPGVIATLQENPVQLERIVAQLRLVAPGARGRAHVPLARRRLHRRVGLRPARHGGARRCPARADRQPLRPAVRGPGPHPLPRVHVLAEPAPLTRGHQPVHDLGAARPVPSRPPLGVRRLPPLRQRRPAPVRARQHGIVRRALTVLKTRASHHQPEIREFTITADGIVLGEAFAPDQRFG